MRNRFVLLLGCLLLALPVAGQEINWPLYEEMAVRQLSRYLQIDTTNPPGNELAAARFFEQWFAAEGIPVEVYEIAPGRANLIARLNGDGSRRPLILLNHMDVVSSDPERWRVAPFSGAILEGHVYGRGALDTKGLGLLQAMVLVMLKRENVPLRRDVLFVATADEEVAMEGAAWLVENKRDLLAAAEYLLNEGGQNLVEDGSVKFFGIDNAEKTPLWLRVRARGRAGHGSRPLPDSAAQRLVRALARVADWQTPLKLLPSVEQFFRDVSRQEDGERAEKFRNIREALHDPQFRRWLTADEEYNYLLRNTISITVLRGSPQTNVIPGEAVAHLDVRLLPGEAPDAFLSELRSVLADDTLEIAPLQAHFRASGESPVDTELFRIIQKIVGNHFPGVPVTTRMLSGYTESALFRPLGIVCYGFSPFVLSRAEQATVHGDNEQLSVENVKQGLRLLYEVVEQAAR